MAGECVVYVTCPDRATATSLADALVTERLAACVNMVPGIDSVFWWEGRLDRAQEVLLIIKTTRRRLAALTKAVRQRHPYDVPEVIALPIQAGHPPYLAWVRQSVRPAPRGRSR